MKSFIKTNIRPLIQIAILILSFFAPIIAKHFWDIDLSKITTENELINSLLVLSSSYGEFAVGIVILVALWIIIRKTNKEEILNDGPEYKDFPYSWYLFCSKILNYRTCRLKSVPIYMQFKLVINDTFKKFEFEDFESTPNSKVHVHPENIDNKFSEINIVISDTFIITPEQIPESNRALPTIWISRDKKLKNTRYIHPELVNTVVQQIKDYEPSHKTINVFATTNPNNTYDICSKAFKSGERSDINKVVIYQQESTGSRCFNAKGKVVYKR